MSLIHAFALLFAVTDGSYVQELLDALNSSNDATIRSFVEKRMATSNPVDAWVKRFKPVALQGAPFKLIKIVDASDRLVRALVEDKSGEKLGFVINLDASKPPRITGVMLSDPDSLNEPPPKDYTGWTSLARLAASVREDTRSPAIALALCREGEPIEAVVDGVRMIGKPEKVGKDEVFHLGSITKSITSTLIGKLVELGKLRWNMTLKEALPGVAMKPGYEAVTLLDVMRHRGGIPRDMNFTGQRVNEIVGDDTDAVKMRARYVADILGRDPLREKEFAYSNAGYAMLGHIAERAMGKPYEQLLHELIFQPLGIATAVVGEEPLPELAPSGHLPGQNGLQPYNMRGKLSVIIAPAGAVSMSISDLVRYGQSHLQGLRGKDALLQAQTIKVLHEPVPEQPGGPGYACGWSVGRLRGTALRHGHNGSNGTFRAELAIFPDTGLIVASIVNRGGESEPSPALQAVLAVAQKFAPAKN